MSYPYRPNSTKMNRFLAGGMLFADLGAPIGEPVSEDLPGVMIEPFRVSVRVVTEPDVG